MKESLKKGFKTFYTSQHYKNSTFNVEFEGSCNKSAVILLL